MIEFPQDLIIFALCFALFILLILFITMISGSGNHQFLYSILKIHEETLIKVKMRIKRNKIKVGRRKIR